MLNNLYNLCETEFMLEVRIEKTVNRYVGFYDCYRSINEKSMTRMKKRL